MRAHAAGQGGLSLLEALVALVLLGVLLAAALPQLFPAPVAVQAAARELAADLNLARQMAISRGEPYVVEFGPPAGAFSRYTVRSGSGQDEPGFPKQLPAGVTAWGPQSVAFLPSGQAQLPAQQVDWRLASGSDSATVRVWSQTGYATVWR